MQGLLGVVGSKGAEGTETQCCVTLGWLAPSLGFGSPWGHKESDMTEQVN